MSRGNQPCRRKIFREKFLRLSNCGNTGRDLQTSLTRRGAHPATAAAEVSRFLDSFHN